MSDSVIPESIEKIHSALLTSYADGFGVNNAGTDSLPRRAEVIGVTEKLLELIFPGFDRETAGMDSFKLLKNILAEKKLLIFCQIHQCLQKHLKQQFTASTKKMITYI